MKEAVKAWRETVVIPTYEIGQAEKYPVFLEKRVYQGSSGSVYPYPVVESISKEKNDVEWEVVYLENKYLKIMVIPALGGRIQMAYDKIRERHFIYYNHVIKPALVGLTGPWISGGIEFNWPQHHRPSTYDPVEFSIAEHHDGSQTVWVSEVERMFRTKGMAGFRLYPDKAYLEINVQLYNRTPHPQTFLWWANPAVKVNDHYQSVFPPDVHAVFDHGKRDVSAFPIAKGTYYKVDYSAGVDISRYKNIPVPTSYMAVNSDYDFVGGYENDSKGGVLHVANHHVSPGKKQWTWGHGDFGQAWDRNLTDEDGPYIELMCGVYTDNQPDFSWLQPYEEKSFKQYFMPYYNVGVVKNATTRAMLNLEIQDHAALMKIHVTAEYPGSEVTLKKGAQVYYQEKVDLSPEKVYEKNISLEEGLEEGLEMIVRDATGQVLVQWTKTSDSGKVMPEAAKAAKMPAEIENNEQLYLRGLHLEQYRHATYDPTAYYLEALSRDPGDVRNNNAMGLWQLKHGQFEKAKTHFQRAIETLTERNPNPYDGEAFFNLGVACMYLDQDQEAYEAFYKACWNAAWQDAGYFHIARIDCKNGRYETALDHIERALIRNSRNHQAQHLKAIILRKTGQIDLCRESIMNGLKVDEFNFGLHFEHYLLNGQEAKLNKLNKLMRGNIHTIMEYAIDYAHAGCYEEGKKLLMLAKESEYPSIHYLLGWLSHKAEDHEIATEHFKKASSLKPDYCFPNRTEELLALQVAEKYNNEDPLCLHLAGNFWYAARQYDEAIDCWEDSLVKGKQTAATYRNLSLAAFNKKNQPKEARKKLEKAFELDPGSARLLMELDQLYKKLNLDPVERLKILEEHEGLVEERDDLWLERISLYNLDKNYKKALELIMARQFQPWEGGEGKVPAQYIFSLVEQAKQELAKGQMEKSLELLEQARTYPYNLGEGKLAGARENDLDYWCGIALKALGRDSEAEVSFRKGTQGDSEAGAAMFYNDTQPDKIFYQGLCYKALNQVELAEEKFRILLNYGEKHLHDEVSIDYFAVSLPDLLVWEDDLKTRNMKHCKYLMGLGKLGLKDTNEALQIFEKILKNDHYHVGAHIHKNFILEQSLITKINA